jgi:hypothetical protein
VSCFVKLVLVKIRILSSFSRSERWIGWSVSSGQGMIGPHSAVCGEKGSWIRDSGEVSWFPYSVINELYRYSGGLLVLVL